MKYLIIVLSLLIFACSDPVYTPKPHAYPRLYFPEKNYVKFEGKAPFTFLYPEYARVIPYREEDSLEHPFWYNINYLPFNATLHVSYHDFKDRGEFDKLFDDTRKLAYKHDIRAEEIEELEVFNEKTHSSGIVYNLKGNTATNLNFYISDGQKHFLRGALYFNAKTQIDSIMPVIQVLKKDVMKMVETTVWKD